LAISSTTGRRAILLFVRDERRESTIKPLPDRYRRKGYAALNRRIIARLAPLIGKGADLIVAREPGPGQTIHGATVLQRGANFGDRITNAIADTLALGYDAVVAVGNDCPTLSPSDISSAFDALARGASAVAAPARDGGAYLIGVRAGTIDDHAFRALPWCTGTLFGALVALPGAAALRVLREDFDRWESRGAIEALQLLFADARSRAASRLPDNPVAIARLHKALTRIFLSAPPLS